MFNSDTNFIYLFFGIVLAYAVSRGVYYFKLRREPTASELDKVIWAFRFNTSFILTMLFVLVFYIGYDGNYADVSPDDSAEKVVRTLTENQNKTVKEIARLKDILYMTVFSLALYFYGVGENIGKLQMYRRQESDKNNPDVQKPLGLS